MEQGRQQGESHHSTEEIHHASENLHTEWNAVRRGGPHLPDTRPQRCSLTRWLSRRRFPPRRLPPRGLSRRLVQLSPLLRGLSPRIVPSPPLFRGLLRPVPLLWGL